MMSIKLVCICIGVGFLCGFLFATLFIAGEDDVDARQIYKDGMKDFAKRLKSRVQKPEFPWEDFFIFESDIDEVLKEMVGEY